MRYELTDAEWAVSTLSSKLIKRKQLEAETRRTGSRASLSSGIVAATALPGGGAVHSIISRLMHAAKKSRLDHLVGTASSIINRKERICLTLPDLLLDVLNPKKLDRPRSFPAKQRGYKGRRIYKRQISRDRQKRRR